MYRIHKDHIIYAMSPENRPCIEVEIGSRLVFETYVNLVLNKKR